jgi:hypothetical protein
MNLGVYFRSKSITRGGVACEVVFPSFSVAAGWESPDFEAAELDPGFLRRRVRVPSARLAACFRSFRSD